MRSTNHIYIIIPVLNEEKNIEKAVESIKAIIPSSHTILIVYDFPTDRTIPIVKKLQKKYRNIILIKNIYGQGVANAVKTGFTGVKNGAAVVMAPDRSDDPKTIVKMIEKISEGADIVSATRYAKGGKRLEQSSLKASLSKFAGLSAPLLLGIPTTDLTNGFKMYRKKVIDSIRIDSQGGWDFTMEIIIKAFHQGFLITELPTISRRRVHGKSKFKLLRWLPKYIYWYTYAIWLRFKRLNYYL